jgi:HAD superfamily hydrolase (TIGR01509 family)
VLVDSERITNTVLMQMLGELGLSLTLEDMFRDFVGRSMAGCLEIVEARLGHAVPADFVTRMQAHTARALRAELEPVAGVREVLAGLDIPCCVASSGDHDKMRLTLGITGLYGHFSGRLFSATEVPRGKPFPDVFLHAARRMGADPARTAVVEDSAVGVAAGVAAGMHVFGYAGLGDPRALAAAGAVVFHRMAELPALLRAGTGNP